MTFDILPPLPTKAEEQEMSVEAVTVSARRRRIMLRDPGVMRDTDYQSVVRSVNVWNDYLTRLTDQNRAQKTHI